MSSSTTNSSGHDLSNLTKINHNETLENQQNSKAATSATGHPKPINVNNAHLKKPPASEKSHPVNPPLVLTTLPSIMPQHHATIGNLSTMNANATRIENISTFQTATSKTEESNLKRKWNQEPVAAMSLQQNIKDPPQSNATLSSKPNPSSITTEAQMLKTSASSTTTVNASNNLLKDPPVVLPSNNYTAQKVSGGPNSSNSATSLHSNSPLHPNQHVLNKDENETKIPPHPPSSTHDKNPPRRSLDDDQELLPFVPLRFHGEHRKAISAVAFAPTSEYSPWNNQSHNSMDTGKIAHSDSSAVCASASADGTVKIWDIKSHHLQPLQLPNNSEKTMGTESDKLYEDAFQSSSTPLTPSSILVGHSRGINDVAWSRTAEYIATASDDKTLRLWDSQTGDALVEFKGHNNFVFALNFNPQSNLIVSGSFDETVKLWDIRSGDCVATIPAHSDPVTAVDFNRDGTCIVSGSHDGLIRVWDTATGECLKTIYAEGNPPVSYVKFSPNGKFVLAGTLDSKLRLWQIASKSSTSTSHHNQQHHQSLKQYDILSKTNLHHKSNAGGKCTKTYSGHANSKYCTFSAFCVTNSRRESILSGSEDGQIFLYNLQSRQVTQVMKGHSDAVLAVAAHDRKEILASGGMTIDRTVRFWAPLPTPVEEH